MKKFLLLVASSLSALPAYAVTQIYDPSVDKGALEVKVGYEYQEDDGVFLTDPSQNLETDIRYGFTDSLGFGLNLSADKLTDNGDFRYEITGLENTIQFVEPGDTSPVSVALRTEYEHCHVSGCADLVNSALLFDYKAQSFEFNINVGGHLEVGEDANNDLGGDIKAMGKFLYSRFFQPGVLYISDTGELNELNDFDDQNNRLGPYLYGNITDNLYYEAAYLVGMTDSARDNSYIVNIGYKVNLENPLLNNFSN